VYALSYCTSIEFISAASVHCDSVEMEGKHLGPWNAEHEAWFLDLISKKICKRIKNFYQRNHSGDLEACKQFCDIRSVWYDAAGEKLVPYFPHFLNTKLQTNMI
jgi:hypothetical protein